MTDGKSVAAKLPKLGFGPVRIHVDYSRLCVWVEAPLLSPTGEYEVAFLKQREQSLLCLILSSQSPHFFANLFWAPQYFPVL